MVDKTIINNWTGGGTLQTWQDGEWQILYVKDSAGNCVTLSLNSGEACRLAYAVSPQPNEQFKRMREYMHAVYELKYPEASADELLEEVDAWLAKAADQLNNTPIMQAMDLGNEITQWRLARQKHSSTERQYG